jgi:tRNA(Arg) A34 adenosine deaminase TadA
MGKNSNSANDYKAVTLMTIDDFSDEYYMNEAIKEARKAEVLAEVPIGAIVVYRRKNYFPST